MIHISQDNSPETIPAFNKLPFVSGCTEPPKFDCRTIDNLVWQQYHDPWKSHTDSDDAKYSRDPQYWIDQIDTWLGEQPLESSQTSDASPPLNPETPGRAFQRLCDFQFDLQKLERICDAPDVLAGDRPFYQQRLAVCMLQIDDITKSHVFFARITKLR